MDISHAIRRLRPGSIWSLNGETYDGLIWDNDNDLPAPTEEEVNEECLKIQQEWENSQYQRDRAKAYPTIQDQLDLLYHGGLDSWKEEINKVKEQYPKP